MAWWVALIIGSLLCIIALLLHDVAHQRKQRRSLLHDNKVLATRIRIQKAMIGVLRSKKTQLEKLCEISKKQS